MTPNVKLGANLKESTILSFCQGKLQAILERAHFSRKNIDRQYTTFIFYHSKKIGVIILGTQLTQNIDYDVTHPKWSPDGKWIVYASNEGMDSKKRKKFDIWLITAYGSQKTHMTTNGSRDDGPCWDHTGKSIYFRSNRGGSWNIWRFEPIMP